MCKNDGSARKAKYETFKRSALPSNSSPLENGKRAVEGSALPAFLFPSDGSSTQESLDGSDVLSIHACCGLSLLPPAFKSFQYTKDASYHQNGESQVNIKNLDLKIVNKALTSSWRKDLPLLSVPRDPTDRRKSCLRSPTDEPKTPKAVQFVDEKIGTSLAQTIIFSRQFGGGDDDEPAQPSPSAVTPPSLSESQKGRAANGEFRRDWAEVRRRLNRDAVCLESLTTTGKRAKGRVVVHNEHYEKSVSARYTLDGWASYREAEAKYVFNGKWGDFYDCFEFEIEAGAERGRPEVIVELALRFETGGRIAWDNNDGRNYVVVVAEGGRESHKEVAQVPTTLDEDFGGFIWY